MRRNRLELAQLALIGNGCVNHGITLQRPGIGRLTDFVVIMAPVYTCEAWRAWYGMVVEGNPRGHGYDTVARSACGYERMGIVEYTPITHTKPMVNNQAAHEGMVRFYRLLPALRTAEHRKLGCLRW